MLSEYLKELTNCTYRFLHRVRIWLVSLALHFYDCDQEEKKILNCLKGLATYCLENLKSWLRLAAASKSLRTINMGSWLVQQSPSSETPQTVTNKKNTHAIATLSKKNTDRQSLLN